MKVADIMTTGGCHRPARYPVGDVAGVFREYSLSGLPVVNAEGELVGLITELDMVSAMRGRICRPFCRLGAYIPLGPKEYRESLRRITGVAPRIS